MDLKKLDDISLYNLSKEITKEWKKRSDKMKKNNSPSSGFKFSVTKTLKWKENVNKEYLSMKGLDEEEFFEKKTVVTETVLPPSVVLERLGVKRGNLIEGCFEQVESKSLIKDANYGKEK